MMVFKLYFFRLKTWMSYMIKAINAHGIHSPFLFDFYNKVIINQGGENSIHWIEDIRARLKRENQVIRFSDYGTAGLYNAFVPSELPIEREQSISEICRKSLAPAKDAMLLKNLIDYLEIKHVWEFGTSLGITSLYLSQGVKVKEVLTIEGSPQIAAIATGVFSNTNASQKIKPVVGPLDEVLPKVLLENEFPDMILFDANHSGEATLNYFNLCVKHKKPECVFIFDDIYWSPSMRDAWVQIKKSSDVTMTIDLYSMGIVFFNKKLSKQDFMLRY